MSAKHVMLSYQWDVQELVSKVHGDLENSGIKCWMDIKGDMHGDMNVSMATGVEKAALIIQMDLTGKWDSEAKMSDSEWKRSI